MPLPNLAGRSWRRVALVGIAEGERKWKCKEEGYTIPEPSVHWCRWTGRLTYVVHPSHAIFPFCLLDKEILRWLERQNAPRPFEAFLEKTEPMIGPRVAPSVA